MELLRLYALSFVGKAYVWGEQDPLVGFDCSGLVREILSSIGMNPPGEPRNAQGLYDYFQTQGTMNSVGLGSLAFYGTDASHITHIAFCLDGYRMIEAGHGDHTTTDIQHAISQKAYVRIRPIKRRPDLVAIIRPTYPTIPN